MSPGVMTRIRAGQWDDLLVSAVRAELARAAGSLTARNLEVHLYEQESVFGLSVRLGPARRTPGWSTYALLEVLDPAFPNLGILTVLDRRDDNGESLADRDHPIFGLSIDNRLVRYVIPAVRSAVAALDPAGRRRGIVVYRMPGRCTAADTCALPMWMAFMLRSARRTEQTLVFADFQRYERVARVCAWLLRGKRLHLFPRTTEHGRSPMRLPPISVGGPPADIQFSAATDVAVGVAREYLAMAS